MLKSGAYELGGIWEFIYAKIGAGTAALQCLRCLQASKFSDLERLGAAAPDMREEQVARFLARVDLGERRVRFLHDGTSLRFRVDICRGVDAADQLGDQISVQRPRCGLLRSSGCVAAPIRAQYAKTFKRFGRNQKIQELLRGSNVERNKRFNVVHASPDLV